MRILNRIISISDIETSKLNNQDLIMDFANHQFSASEEFWPDMDERSPTLNTNDFRYIYPDLDCLKRDLNILMNEEVYHG